MEKFGPHNNVDHSSAEQINSARQLQEFREYEKRTLAQIAVLRETQRTSEGDIWNLEFGRLPTPVQKTYQHLSKNPRGVQTEMFDEVFLDAYGADFIKADLDQSLSIEAGFTGKAKDPDRVNLKEGVKGDIYGRLFEMLLPQCLEAEFGKGNVFIPALVEDQKQRIDMIVKIGEDQGKPLFVGIDAASIVNYGNLEKKLSLTKNEQSKQQGKGFVDEQHVFLRDIRYFHYQNEKGETVVGIKDLPRVVVNLDQKTVSDLCTQIVRNEEEADEYAKGALSIVVENQMRKQLQAFRQYFRNRGGTGDMLTPYMKALSSRIKDSSKAAYHDEAQRIAATDQGSQLLLGEVLPNRFPVPETA